MINSKHACPVCNAEKSGNSTTCEKCGFEGAYYTLFSGEKAYNMWKSLVDAQKSKLVEGYYKKSRENGGELIITSDRVCFFDAEKSKAVIVEFNNDEPFVLDNVKQVALSGLYHVWLNSNGTLGSSGDGESGQRKLGDLIEIVNVATTPECTYAVRADGTVTSRGATSLNDEISSWTNIKALCCAEHVIGIKEDKTIVYAVREGSLFSSYASVMKGWKNVRKVVTADYYAMALCEDGTILYAGANDRRSDCTQWKNIVDIAADNQYAVGLTKNGDVLLAGETSSVIDFGRSEAAKWKDMAFVSAGRALIAGLSKTGELKLVGNIGNIVKNDIVAKNLKNAIQEKLAED